MPNMNNMDEALRIHAKYVSSDSDSGKSEFDEEYYRNKPPPMWIPPAQTVVVCQMNSQYGFFPQHPVTNYDCNLSNNFYPHYNSASYNQQIFSAHNTNYNQTNRPEPVPTDNLHYNQAGAPEPILPNTHFSQTKIFQQVPPHSSTRPARIKSPPPKNKKRYVPPQKHQGEEKPYKSNNGSKKIIAASQANALPGNSQSASTHSVNKSGRTIISEGNSLLKKTNKIPPKYVNNSRTNAQVPINKTSGLTSRENKYVLSKPPVTNEEANSNNVTQIRPNSTSENVNQNLRNENSFWDVLVNCLSCCF